MTPGPTDALLLALLPVVARLDDLAALVAGPWHRAYAALWCCACLGGLALAARSRARLAAELPAYARLLAVPWKVATAVPAIAFVALAGRFTEDATWDVPTGLGMACLAYLGAPWALGLAWGAARGRRPRADGVLALVVALASASWAYDAWQWWRTGSYPLTWLGNLDLSCAIYLCAGVVWSLEVRGGRVALAPSRADWPAPPADRSFGRLVLPALPPAAVALALLVGYVRWRT